MASRSARSTVLRVGIETALIGAYMAVMFAVSVSSVFVTSWVLFDLIGVTLTVRTPVDFIRVLGVLAAILTVLMFVFRLIDWTAKVYLGVQPSMHRHG